MKGALKPPQVSERDRDYFRRLGEWERENRSQRLRDHLALSIETRIRESWAISRQVGAHLKLSVDDGAERFYERARRLGLIRS